MLNTNQNYSLFLPKLLAIVLIILGARLWLLNIAGIPIPIVDEWEIGFHLVIPWLNDSLTFEHIFKPYAEHPIALTRLLTLLLIVLNNQWDPLLEAVVNIGIYILTVVILIFILRQLLAKELENWILFSVALLAIIPYGWLNIIWSFQSSWYMMLFFSLLTIWGLLLHNSFTLNWWIGIFCGFLAGLNLGTGFFALIIVLIIKLYLIVINREKIKEHLITLSASILIATPFVIQLLNVPHRHTGLYSRNLAEFFSSLGQFMAWPWIDYPLISFLIYLPVLVFVIRIIWLRRVPSQSELFLLALGGWVILQAIAMAFARGAGQGTHSISRYWEILSFGVLINLFTFHLITQQWFGLTGFIKQYLNIFAGFWAIGLLFGIFHLMVNEIPAIQQNQSLNAERLKNARTLLLTGEIGTIKNRMLFPYPSIQLLKHFLKVDQFRNLLTVQLATPSLIPSVHHNGTFVKNGFFHTTGKHKGEDVLGSYNHQRNPAMGRFESVPISIEQGFLEIPVAGYLGIKDLSLQLVVEGEKPIELVPPALPRERWLSLYVPTPAKPFRIVAVDNRPDFWFAFAMPRGIGTLSFYNSKLLSLGETICFIGLILLGLIVGSKAFATFTKA